MFEAFVVAKTERGSHKPHREVEGGGEGAASGGSGLADPVQQGIKQSMARECTFRPYIVNGGAGTACAAKMFRYVIIE